MSGREWRQCGRNLLEDGYSDATFYKWKKKFGSLGVYELRRLRQLEGENKRLIQIVADFSLDKQMLQDILKIIFESPSIENAGSTTHRSIPGFQTKGFKPGTMEILKKLTKSVNELCIL